MRKREKGEREGKKNEKVFYKGIDRFTFPFSFSFFIPAHKE